MSENFYFACIPRYLRVEHSFAKGIKQNTKYRIGIFKGIQKCDEMKQAIKSKIVGGKIDLESPQLFFNIAFFNPTKNIQFTIKLFQQKPNEDETEIGFIAIMSSDYIKSFKTHNKVWHQIEAMLKDDLFCTFDLIIEKQKSALIEAVKKFNPSIQKGENQIEDDIKSQSSASKQIIRQGEGLVSPGRKIQRRNGRKLKLRSRNSNRSEDQQSDAGSVTSQNKPLRKIQPSERQEKFLQSPNRIISTKAPYIERSHVSKSNIVSSTFKMKFSEADALQQSLPTESFVVDDSQLPTFSNPMIQSDSQIMMKEAKSLIINPKKYQIDFQHQNTQKEFHIAQKKKENIGQNSFQSQQQKDIKLEDKEEKVKDEDEKSEKTEKSIRIKEQQVKREKSGKIQSQRIILSSKANQIKRENTEIKIEQQSQLKTKILYSVFLIISAYLIYIAMLPTRRV